MILVRRLRDATPEAAPRREAKPAIDRVVHVQAAGDLEGSESNAPRRAERCLTMCGIAGALDLTGRRDFDRARLEAMAQAIVHRGPDDGHCYLEPGVALAARRLAIVDLEGGRQPLSNEDGSVWVAFNGELFDYPDLQASLTARGHRLATRCDTELWAHLWEDHREAMFDHARGQFAVSLWDRHQRTLILGRDRIGIAPLYVAQTDGWLLWSSEIKGLLASGMVPSRPDPKGILHFFTFFCAGTPRTFFEGIELIPPGHYWKVRDGRMEIHKYWDLDFPDRGDEVRADDPTPLIDELEARLVAAVERRLRADVPVVSYISGGLDSTMVLGTTTRLRGRGVPSFTIDLKRAGPNERDASTDAAQTLESPLTTLTMDKRSIVAGYPDLITAAEGPVLDTSCVCLMRLAEKVHEQGYKVVLTGEGADEALAGYVWFKSHKLRERLRGLVGDRLMRTLRGVIPLAVGGDRTILPPPLGIGGARPAQQEMYEAFLLGSWQLLNPDLKATLKNHDPFTELLITNERMTKWHPLNQSLYVGYRAMLAGLLMIGKGDRIAMRSSVETRYPFLDERVVEFCATLDPELKLKRLTEKWILRKVAERILPARIANRPKTMFRASRSEAFLGPDRPSWVDQLLSPESLTRTGLFDPEAVARQVKWQRTLPRITPRRAVFDISLVCVAATQLWHHLYLGGGLCDLPVWSPPAIESVGTARAISVAVG